MYAGQQRDNSECQKPFVRHGVVMVLGCISASGVGDFLKADKIVNEEK